MYNLLLFLAPLLTSVTSQDISALTAQFPPCITFIGNGCGSPTDWACGCSLTNGSYMNFGCYTAVVECTSYQVVGSQSLIDQICAIEAQSHATSSGKPAQTSVTGATSPDQAPTGTASTAQTTTGQVTSASSLKSTMEATYLAIGAVLLWFMSMLF